MSTLLKDPPVLKVPRGWAKENNQQLSSGHIPRRPKEYHMGPIPKEEKTMTTVLEINNIEVIERAIKYEKHFRYTDGVNPFNHFMIYLLLFLIFRYTTYFILGSILPVRWMFICYTAQAVVFWVMTMRFVTVYQTGRDYRQKIRDTSPTYKITESWTLFNGNTMILTPKKETDKKKQQPMIPQTKAVMIPEPAREPLKMKANEVVFRIDTIRHIKQGIAVDNYYLYSEPANGLNVFAAYVLVFLCTTYILSFAYFAILPHWYASWYDFLAKIATFYAMGKRFAEDWIKWGRFREENITSTDYDLVEKFEL